MTLLTQLLFAAMAIGVVVLLLIGVGMYRLISAFVTFIAEED